MKELSLLNSRLDGRYDIKELLGRGSYAEIYVASDTVAAPTAVNKTVVVKALNVFLQNDLDADLERTLVENFQNEAIALDRVRHPNILSRLGHGTARDLRGTVFHYLVLEYLAGGDLQKATREKSLTFAQTFSYLEQVCAGLAHAHQAGVIHRDIKPQNLLLTADRKTVKIADFGVARFQQSDSPITRVGTNIYAPPEHSPMLSDDGRHYEVAQLTPAADIYSLAKTAYALFTCESPRMFANRQVVELPFADRQKPWAKDLLEVLGKATRNDPKERHQDIYEFWKDLSRLKQHEEPAESEIGTRIAARATTPATSSPVLAPPPKPHPSTGYSPIAPTRPDFNTSRDLKLGSQVLRNPALVVKVENAAAAPPPPAPLVDPNIPAPQPVPDIRQPIIIQEEIVAPRRRGRGRKLAALGVGAAVFLGVLYGTHSYLRSHNYVPEIRWPFGAKSGVTTTDVNLRAGADPGSQQLNTLPKNSRVRVVNSKDNWYEVDVVEFGPANTLRDKQGDNANAATGARQTGPSHGWVNAKYVDLDD